MVTIGRFMRGGVPDDSPIYGEIENDERYRQSVDSIGIGDLTDCSFGLIKEILIDMEGGFPFEKQYNSLVKIIAEKGLKTNLLDMELLTFVQQLNYMKDCLNEIIETERQLLSDSDFDEKAERAAIGDDGKSLFDGIEVYLQLRSLANEDITKIDAVEHMKYSDCLLELYTRQQLRKFEKNYERLSKRK